MSKLTKLLRSPQQFLEDARNNMAARRIANMSEDDMERFGLAHSGMSATDPKMANQQTDLILAQKLLNFERNFPVNSLLGGDMAPELMLWPLFRHLFWVRCQAAYKGKNAALVNTQNFYISRDWQRHYAPELSLKTVDELIGTQCDFLFFTNLRGTEQTLIDGKIYNRITDPIFEAAQTIGAAKKVEVIKSTGKIWPHRVHDVDLILPPMVRKIGYASLTDRPRNFVNEVNKQLPEVKFDERSYNECIEWFFHQCEFYETLLRTFSPKVVFFVGFDYHYALICAAKSLGIQTVDLQHGVQAGWSPVYNHWQVNPPRGYGMLPDTFWVWGDYDAGKIRETFGDNPDSCGVEALVGGFPWLDRQQGFIDEKMPEQLKKLARNPRQMTPKKSSGGVASLNEMPNDVERRAKKIGLLTLQDQTVFPALFVDIIKKTTDQIEWVIKRHPKHQSINLSVIKKDALYGKSFDNASFLTLIRVADIHLTECSTSVIESDYFGVPSVVTGEQGLINYSDFIDEGTVHHIESAEEFIERLDSILAIKGASRMNVVDNNNTIERTLRDLLEKHND